MKRQKALVAGFGVAAAAVAMTAQAWACTAQLGMKIKPGGGAAGATVTVEGQGAPGPVDIRWNSPDGPIIGRAADGTTFAVGVRIPQATPGVYTVLAVSPTGNVAPARAAFEVRPGGAVPAAAGHGELWSGFSSAKSDAVRYEAAASPASGSSPQLLAGVALLGGGAVALAAGIAVAEVRRRKVLAR